MGISFFVIKTPYYISFAWTSQPKKLLCCVYIEAAAMNFRERSAQTPSKAKPTKKNGEKEKEREKKSRWINTNN